MSRGKKTKRSKSGKNRTPISGHTRHGKELLPPFAKIAGTGKMAFSSWMNERLPEMIWAALIREALGQEYALGLFRRFLNFIGKHEKKALLSDVTITSLSKLDVPLREEIIAFIVEPPDAARSLATLRLFKSLPARQSWDKLLPEIEPNIELLMSTVGSNLWHQSQEATDCRWLRVMAQVVTGNLHIPEETAKNWFGYPNKGEQRSVRPSIRAAEIAPRSMEPPDLTWPNAFWEEAWHNTPCLALVKDVNVVHPGEVFTRSQVGKATEALEEHWGQTHSTTAIDAKHDAIFGMAFYSLRILQELLGIGIGTSIIGRLGLRTILEVRITLHYLIKNDDKKLWEKWRMYGAGQAKLNALKFDDNIVPPKHIDIESIERIASEDIWEEFLTINLGNWSGLDLRRLSEKADLKDIYDSHYSWTSGYTHGTWGPIRESCYQTCGNPLHRLHRYPERRALTETIEDAAQLVDCILEDVDIVYPSFAERIVKNKK
jgi:hypothetical protein